MKRRILVAAGALVAIAIPTGAHAEDVTIGGCVAVNTSPTVVWVGSVAKCNNQSTERCVVFSRDTNTWFVGGYDKCVHGNGEKCVYGTIIPFSDTLNSPTQDCAP